MPKKSQINEYSDLGVCDMNLYEGHADQVLHMPVFFLHIMSNEVT